MSILTIVQIVVSVIVVIFLFFMIFKKSKKKVKRGTESKETAIILFKRKKSFWGRFFTETIGDNIEEKTKEELKEIYFLNKIRFWVSAPVGYLILYLLSLFVWISFSKQSGGGESLQNAVLIPLFHFVISWFNIVGDQERGAIYIFKKPLFLVGRGIHFVPFGFCTLLKLPRTLFGDEIPTTQDKVWRSKRDEADFIPFELQREGYKHPVRVQFAGFSLNEKVDEMARNTIKTLNIDPFMERMTIEVPGYILWRIEDVIKFNSKIGGIGDIEKARIRMANVYVTSVTTHLPKVTLAEFYERREFFDEEIFKEVDLLTDQWGVRIERANIKEPKHSHELNTSILRMSKAKAEMRAQRFEGKGLGEKEKAILLGRTQGLLDMAEKLKLDPRDILAAETSRYISENVDNLISAGSGGFGDLLSMVAATAAAFKIKDKKITETEERKGDNSE